MDRRLKGITRTSADTKWSQNYRGALYPSQLLRLESRIFSFRVSLVPTSLRAYNANMLFKYLDCLFFFFTLVASRLVYFPNSLPRF